MPPFDAGEFLERPFLFCLFWEGRGLGVGFLSAVSPCFYFLSFQQPSGANPLHSHDELVDYLHDSRFQMAIMCRKCSSPGD